MIRNIAFLSTAAAALMASCAAFAGNSNNVFVNQFGSTQTLNIDQTGGNYNSVGSSSSAVQQDNGSLGGGNSLAITQTGSNNTFGVAASSYQGGQSNQDTVTQSGSYSSIEAIQAGLNNGNGTYGRAASFINQNADYSDVNVTSNDTGNAFQIYQGSSGNHVTAGQSNSNNLLAIDQGYSFGYSDTNIITASQTGSGNTAGLTQGGSNNASSLAQSGNSNQAYVRQVSNNSNSYVGQTGDSNLANVTQYGNLNTSYLYQYGSSGTATIYQGGSNDTSTLTQANGSINIASVSQSGSNNGSSLGQYGSNNMVTVSQGGSYNNTTLAQNGTGNYANIKQ